MVKRQTVKAKFKASNVSGIFVHRNLRVNYVPVPRAPPDGLKGMKKKVYLCL